MYRVVFTDGVYRVEDPKGKLSKWWTYSRKEAWQRADELDRARAYYFIEEV